MTHKLR